MASNILCRRSDSLRTVLVFLLLRFQWNCAGVEAQTHQGPNRPPTFISGGDLSRFTISEDTPLGTVIYRLKGSDPEQGELTYSISGEYFRVNKRTGDITLIKELDRENEASIDVIISLTDDGHGGEPETISLRKEILILDVNDNKPIYEKTPYSFKVSEKARVGSTVFSDIVITDEDFETNSQITLTCDDAETQIACKFFSVTAERVGEGNYIGIITLAAPLDFEVHSHFTLKLKASDGLNVVTTIVAITVLDVQDQSPKFFGGPYVFMVKENSGPGTKVGEISVQDGDTGNPRDLQIKLIDEAQNDYFRLTNIQKDPFTGTFSAIVETSENILDAEDEFIRENLGVYELTLEAREFPLNPQDTEPTLVTRVGLAVMVQDVDDHLPVFNPSEFTRILRIPYNPEESWTFPDFHVEVEDVDEEPAHAQFNLSFDWNLATPIPVEQVFAFVTPSNANPTIQSKGVVTIEVLNISLLQPGSSFNLEIRAYQKDHLVSKINVPMEVAPGPKILPIFNNTVYRVAVPEDIHEGEVITKIAAKNGAEIPGLTYSLIGVGSDRFKVDDKSGEIRCGVPNCLDFERERNNFFLVRAKSGKGVEEEVYALFYLDTQPKNDESPTFSDKNSVRRSVPDGTLLFDPPFLIKATDMDLNDQISYTVVDHSMNTSGIYIEPESGELRLKKRLSWAEGGEHKLTVTATDKSGKIAEQSVLLIVQPVQNIPPSFPYEVHSVRIPETTLSGSAIFRTVAHDPDGQDAALKYYIESQPEPDLFYIEENNGMIHLGKNGKLDFEEKQSLYSVIVRVQDEGKPSEIAKAIIEIAITDVNDEAPKFSEKNYVTDMSESFKADHGILQLRATDTDEDSKLEFSISCPCQVWDASGSMGSKTDAAKYFSYLRLDPKLGDITLIIPLEHKLASVLEFQATVKDKNGVTPQSDTATVTVYVTAAERLTPYFGEPWTPSNPWINLTIPEDMEAGRNVVTLNAWDYVADEEISNFQLVDDDTEPFALEDNVLRVTSPLDYETRKNYMVAVKAIDSRGGASIAKLAITISDVNDNAPVFNKPEYKGKVAENSEFPTPILTVEASDRDDPDNYGAVHYAITGPQSHLFSIDELAGVVQVAPGADIDREADSSHTIFVLALDTPLGGPFQRTTMATLKIQVTDKNDNDPYCTSSEHLVAENAPIGTKIGNVTCIDPDEDPKLVYNLRDETKLGLFAIDSKTGSLSVTKSLRGRGRAAPYLVTVTVEDGKDRGVSIPVEIKIANLVPNDGRPHFVNENLTGEVSEGAFRGTPIMHIIGSDTDSFDNGEGRLAYKLLKQVYPCHNQVRSNGKKANRVDEVDYFRIDESSGMLTLQNSVDREKHDCLSVLVSVSDSGTPPRSETQWYTIVVTDTDDGVPFLPKQVRNLNLIVNETTTLDSVLFNYTGIDTDIFPNNRIGFELTGGAGDYFKLRANDEQSVSLVVSGNLEKLEHDELTMVVKCFPKERKVPVADCSSKVHIRIRRDSPTSEKLKTKITEMIFGVATGVPVGNLIGNTQMPAMKKIISSVQMYHPNLISQSPTNVTEVVRIDSNTGDILVWDNLEQYQNGHLRVELSNPQPEINSDFGGVKKKLKIFISPNDQLLSTDTSDYPKLNRWAEEVEKYLNTPKTSSKINHGVFRILTFDHSNAPEGKTMICFQLLENENMVSQEKSLQLLNYPDVQDIFLKFTFGDELQKGCPQRPRNPARLTVAGSTGRFWVERSLVGIASVVALATISAILILCLVNRQQRREKM